ncbi:MAG: tetratricopeptide repeat protein [Vicingaceae bacterium]
MLVVSSITNAQKYFDSLTTYIVPLSDNDKVEAINKIPFDIMNSNTSVAIKMYKQALKIADKNNNLEQLALSKEKIAIAYYYRGDYDLSTAASLASIRCYEALENNLKAGGVYASLGYQMKRRDLPKAFEYMKKGIALLEQINDEPALSGAYNNYGVLHEMNNEMDSALYYYQKGLLIVEELSDSIGIPYSLNNIAGAYVILEDYSAAIPYYNRAFAIRKQRNDLNGMAENYSYYGDFYFKQGQYKQAILYYLNAEEITKKINYTYLQKMVSQELALCYSKINDFQQALYYQKKSVELEESFLNETSNKSIAELEAQFDTEKKEKKIADQKILIAQKELKVKQRNYFIYSLIAIGVLLLSVAYFVLKQIRFKQQKLIEENRLKDQIAEIKVREKLNNERVRISRDLHDNIGSQLTFIISSIDNMSYFIKDTNNELKEKLQELNNFSRSAIAQLRDTIKTLNKS